MIEVALEFQSPLVFVDVVGMSQTFMSFCWALLQECLQVGEECDLVGGSGCRPGGRGRV